MRLTNIIEKDHDLINFIANTSNTKNSLITGANAGAFDLLLCQIVGYIGIPQC